MDNKLQLVTWKNYSPRKAGQVFTYASSMSSELPIRDVFGEQNKGEILDPNLETSTFGFCDCLNLKERLNFVKKQKKYAFFMTKYAGSDADYEKKLLITGYMEIDKVKNMYGRVGKCFDLATSAKMDSWWAFYGEMKFVALKDCFEVTDKSMKEIGKTDFKKINRLMTIDLTEEEAENLVAYFEPKDNAFDAYKEEIESLNALIA